MNPANNNSDHMEEKDIKPLDQTRNNSLLDKQTRMDSNMDEKGDPEGKKRVLGWVVEVEDESAENAAPPKKRNA